MTRTAAIAAAAALGVIGIVLGAVALARSGGGKGFEAKTLTLQGAQGKRVEFEAPILVKGHPAGVKAWQTTHPISGDASGEIVITCIPMISNDIDCAGGFQLADGDINIENVEHADTGDTSAQGSILGGSGAYEGAYGSWNVDWKTHIYKLHLWLPTS